MMSHSNHSSHDSSHELGHIVPAAVFLKVFAALVVLTIITVAVSRVHLGAWNIVVAMGVASIKATLVALFFMHLKYESPLTWMYAVLPLILLGLLLGGVFLDNPYRHIPKPGFDVQPITTMPVRPL
jgi:cytochrome c oxidase subunit 4